MIEQLTHLSLFTGIGGIDLAAEWAGFETVGQCEWADYPTKVLEKHWPNKPRWRDIHDLTAESFYEKTGLRTVTVVSGGFPCQPFSISGKQQGTEDNRWLWPDMYRIIGMLRPSWVIGENVENIVRMVIDEIINDLEKIDYTVQTFVVSAFCAGAWFDGKRTFIVASANDRSTTLRGDREHVTIKEFIGCTRNYTRRVPELFERERWQFESRPVGVAYGVPFRVDRIKGLGNAVNPRQIYPILKAIADIEIGHYERVGD